MALPAPPAGSPALSAAAADARIPWPTRILFGLLLLTLGGTIGYGTSVLLRPTQVAPGPLLTPPGVTAVPPELELRFQILRNQLDNAAERSKRIDELLTFLLTLTSLYAVALGLSSYFGLKQILDSGKEDLNQLRGFLDQARVEVREKMQEVDTKLDKFQTELRQRYPELANLDSNLRDVFNEILLMSQPGRDWKKLYGEFTAEQREKFSVAEMRLAGLEVFRLGDLDSYQPDVLRVYQTLGRFYSSRYGAEKLRSHWERASIYFNAAVRLNPGKPPAELMKDVGVHLTMIEQIVENRQAIGETITAAEIREVGALRDRAELAFRESLAANSLEPGALVGLAWILYKQGNYRNALSQCVLLTEIKSWTPGDREKFLEGGWLNRAYCHSLLAGADPTDSAYQMALKELQESKKIAEEYARTANWKVTVENEAASGDLQKLRAAKPQEVAEVLA
jgi:tetratricopeptide (TPR) repeat protein